MVISVALYLTDKGENTMLYKIKITVYIIVDNLKSVVGIVCKGGEFLTQFWRHGGIEYNRGQKEENLIALD